MGFFDFMGTFFFISLGITFVLILLLAYHFKQRLSESEQKSDKMFEIINTIVKEMGNMKRAISQCSASLNDTCVSENYTMPYIKKEKEYDSDDEDEDEDDRNHDNTDHDNVDHDNVDHNNADVSKLYSSLNMYDHDNAVFIELGHPTGDNNLNDDESEDKDDSVEIVEHEPEVKVVNVDLTYDSHDIVTDEEDPVSDFELDDIEDSRESTDVPELHSVIGEEVIHVNKLDEVMTPVVEDHDSSSEEEKLSYHKMNLTQLRAYAVNKGILSDSSKMKKADLIKLLESNDEN